MKITFILSVWVTVAAAVSTTETPQTCRNVVYNVHSLHQVRLQTVTDSQNSQQGTHSTQYTTWTTTGSFEAEKQSPYSNYKIFSYLQQNHSSVTLFMICVHESGTQNINTTERNNKEQIQHIVHNGKLHSTGSHK